MVSTVAKRAFRKSNCHTSRLAQAQAEQQDIHMCQIEDNEMPTSDCLEI